MTRRETLNYEVDGAVIKVLVVPTDEEREIAHQTLAVLEGIGQ